MDIPQIGVLSAAGALPGAPVDNATLARRLGMGSAMTLWMDAFIGTDTRHLALDLDSGKQCATLAQLGAQAGAAALRRAGCDPADVDVMVLATATPDALMPATVNMVAELLGVDGIPTYQLQSGCCGAYQALDLGCRLLQTGAGRRALVLGGDVLAKHLDLGMDTSGMPPAELVNLLLFGDGAGAAVLAADPPPGTAVIRQVLNRLTGLGRAPGQRVEWFGMADRDLGGSAAREDYQAIKDNVPQMAGQIAQELLGQAGWSGQDVDYLLPPQLSGVLTAQIVERLGLPAAQEVSCVRETANTGNAVPFLQLERLLPHLAPGDRALGVAVESSKWIRAGITLERS